MQTPACPVILSAPYLPLNSNYFSRSFLKNHHLLDPQYQEHLTEVKLISSHESQWNYIKYEFGPGCTLVLPGYLSLSVKHTFVLAIKLETEKTVFLILSFILCSSLDGHILAPIVSDCLNS